MKAAKLLKIGAEILKMMSENDLRVKDVQHLDLYVDYQNARKNKVKYNAIVYDLSIRYNISESTVKRIIRRFEREV